MYHDGKIISDLVDALALDSLSIQKRYFLTQSLLLLVHTAKREGHRQGCQDTILEIHRQLDNSYELTGVEISELAATGWKMNSH